MSSRNRNEIIKNRKKSNRLNKKIIEIKFQKRSYYKFN